MPSHPSPAPGAAQAKRQKRYPSIPADLVPVQHCQCGCCDALRDLYRLIDKNSGRPSVHRLFIAMQKAKAAIERHE